MVFQDQSRGAIDRRPDGRELKQYIRAGAPVFDHSFDRTQVARRAGKLVDNSFGVPVRTRNMIVQGYPPGGDINTEPVSPTCSARERIAPTN